MCLNVLTGQKKMPVIELWLFVKNHVKMASQRRILLTAPTALTVLDVRISKVRVVSISSYDKTVPH